MNTPDWMKHLIKEAEQSLEYNLESAFLNFAEQVCMEMEKKEVKKAELARFLGKSRAYVTKVLSGTYNKNLTLRTMVSFAMALGKELDIQFVHKEVEVKKQVERVIVQRGPPAVMIGGVAISASSNAVLSSSRWQPIIRRKYTSLGKERSNVNKKGQDNSAKAA